MMNFNFKASNISENGFGLFEMDANGNFRLTVRDSMGNTHKGSHTVYQGVATLEVEGKTYVGFSSYYAGDVPVEQVLLLQKPE